MYQGIHIESDDADVESMVRELAQQIVDGGGYIHPGLRVRITQGQLMIESDVPESETLIKVPEACLLPLDEVVFKLDGDHMEISSCPPGYDSRRAILDTMVAIYNQGNKIYQHRREMPWLAFADVTSLIDLLYKARMGAPKPTRFYNYLKEGKLDELVIDSYFSSRTLRYLFADNTQQKVLMPFIDFFNHHVNSPPFGRDENGLVVSCSRPVPGSNECFVRYSFLDPMDTYLGYGFTDASPPFLRSVPVEISIPEIGSINILAQATQPGDQPLPAELENLRALLPVFYKQSDAELLLSHLYVPGATAPRSMHRILTYAIQQLSPDLQQAELDIAVNDAVEKIVSENEAYYTELNNHLASLENDLESTPALEQLKSMIGLQQQRLQTYRNMPI